jgi:hypothetical protein
VDEATHEISKLIRSEPLERPLHLQVIVQASNLIRFPRVPKVAKDNSRPSLPSSTATDAPVNVAEISSAPQKPAELFQSSSEEETLPTAQVKTVFSRQRQILLEEVPAADMPATASSAADQESRSEEIPADVFTTPLACGETVPVIEFADHNTPLETESNDLPVFELARPFSEKEPSETETTIAFTAKGDFDKRLLDDLIRNYGEFAASADLSEPLKSRTEKATRAKVQYRHAESKTPEDKAVKTNVPSLKREGELDRQLKKLIKDYGEYDLYRQHSPISLKTGVIAAFLLLGIILSGFYFFSARQPAVPPHNSVTTTSTSERADGISPSANVEIGTGKVISNGNSRPARPDQTAGEESRGAVNNPSLKPKK